MPSPVKVPELGSNQQSMRLSAWFVEPGDAIERGDPLFEVLISGVTCDVAAELSGRVARIEKELDELVVTGETVAWIDETRAAGPHD